MRISVKPLAGLLAVLMALALVNSREWSNARGRDSVIRVTRGAQRLDATDAAPHGDDAEIGLPQPALVATPTLGLDGPSLYALPVRAASFIAPPAPLVVQVGVPQPRLLARPLRPALGRAPPLA
jgi:hypothetical protein